MYKLIIEDDEGKTTVVPLIRDEISIGRKEGNTIRLTERNVSRRHARIVRQNGGAVYLEDLQSHNGIKVNGERIDGKAAIGEGDRIQIGDYQLSLKLDRTETKPPPATSGAADNQPTSQFVKPEAAPQSSMTVPTMAMPAAAAPQPAAHTAVVPLPAAAVPAPAPGAAPERPGRLIVISQNFFAQEFPLDKAAVVIGRTDENDVVINHRSISRHHAKVVREGGHFHIVDLQSANGVRVNGEEYGKVELRKGDKIDLGHVRLVFVPPGQDYELKGKGEVTEKDDRGGKLWLAAGAAVLIAVAVAGVKFGPKLLGGAAGKADPDVEAVTVLADIDGDLVGKRWGDAATKAEGLLRRTDVSSARREVAATKKERAELEKRNQDIYDRFSKAGGSTNYDDALKIYRELAPDSVYRQVAKEEYDKIFPLFVSSHLQKAEAARRSGDCGTVHEEVEKVLAVEPKHLQALAAKDQPCGGKAPPAERPEPVAQNPTRRNKNGAKTIARNDGKTEEPSKANPDNGGDNGGGGDEGDSEVERKLKEAQNAYINGEPKTAIELARSVGRVTKAWRTIGAAACQLKDLKLINEAYRRLDPAGKQYLVYVCQRSNIAYSSGQFKLNE